MERNILLTIEYDGTEFCGWQKQKDVRTVQGDVEAALSKACGADVHIDGTSRTDAGVHALGQRASFSGNFGIPTDRIMLTVNNLLASSAGCSGKPADVQITDVREVGANFHARFDSQGKKYRYIIRNKGDFDIFRRNYCYQVREPLNIEAMRDAATFVCGTHDFACFQAAGGTPRDTTVRTVHGVDVFHSGEDDITVEISGDGFLYNMVRIIVGTLVEAGLGKREPAGVANIIAGKDRREAGHTAPPQGLYLVEVYYSF